VRTEKGERIAQVTALAEIVGDAFISDLERWLDR